MCENFLYGFKAGPPGASRPPSGPGSHTTATGNRSTLTPGDPVRRRASAGHATAFGDLPDSQEQESMLPAPGGGHE